MPTVKTSLYELWSQLADENIMGLAIIWEKFRCVLPDNWTAENILIVSDEKELKPGRKTAIVSSGANVLHLALCSKLKRNSTSSATMAGSMTSVNDSIAETCGELNMVVIKTSPA